MDNEAKWPERWAKIKVTLGALLLQWVDGYLEQHVIPMFEPTMLPSLLEDPEGTRTGMRLRSLAERLENEETDIERIKVIAGDGLAQLIIEAATGSVPEKFAESEDAKRKRFKGHASVWFKSMEGGRELAEKVFTLGAWPKLQAEALPFVNAVRQTIGLPAIPSLPG